MRLTHEEFKRRFPHHPQPAPIEFAGQWVAWNEDHTRIVAHGNRMDQVHAEAVAAGCDWPVMQKVIGTAFVGVGLSRA